MRFIINIYIKDVRTKSGKALICSHEHSYYSQEDIDYILNSMYCQYVKSEAYLVELIK